MSVLRAIAALSDEHGRNVSVTEIGGHLGFDTLEVSSSLASLMGARLVEVVPPQPGVRSLPDPMTQGLVRLTRAGTARLAENPDSA